jgi:hypothetical protein
MPVFARINFVVTSALCGSLLGGWGEPLLLAQAPPASTADSPADTSLPDVVQRWLRQLDDRELARRQAAERALLDLGPVILPHLPAPTARMSAELRQRLARITGQLQSAAGEAVTGSTYVNLTGEFTVAEILEAFEKQTGNQVAGMAAADRKLEVSFSETPYWKALDDVLDRLELTIDPYGGRAGMLVVTGRPPSERPRLGSAHYQDAFRVEAVRIVATRDLRNPMLQGMRVTLSVGWEPRIAPISFFHPLAKLEAEDELGNLIEPGVTRATREVPVHPGMAAVEFEVPLALAAPASTQLARLHGELEALVPGRVETFEFDGDLTRARGVQQRRAGVVVTLQGVRRNQDLYQLQVRVQFDEASGALESHRGWIFNNEAYLLDQEGHRIANAGLEATRQEQNEVGVAYLFDVPDGLEGCKFVYKTPAVIVRHTISYELEDMPLP